MNWILGLIVFVLVLWLIIYTVSRSVKNNTLITVSLDEFAKMAIEDSYSQAKKYVQKQKNGVLCISGVVCETSYSVEGNTIQEHIISMQKDQNPQIQLDFVFPPFSSVLQDIYRGDLVTVEGTLMGCTNSADKAIACDEEDFSGPHFIFRNCKITTVCDGNGNKKQ